MTSQPAPKQRRPLSPEALAYLEQECEAETKSEFHCGTIVAMAGVSIAHNRIGGNLYSRLLRSLRDTKCEPLQSDVRVLVEECEAYFYPDVFVVCGTPELSESQPPSVCNPTVIIEVLSASTEGNDRGFKFQCYRTIPTLREYVLIAQNRVLVEHYVRQNETMWLLQTLTDLNATLSLESCEVSITLTELYARVFTP